MSQPGACESWLRLGEEELFTAAKAVCPDSVKVDAHKCHVDGLLPC